MRLVYNDPLVELKALIEQAKSSKHVRSIAMTKTEFKACLAHAKAIDVFPQFINEREKKVRSCEDQIKRLKMQSEQMTEGDERTRIFDRIDRLEDEIAVFRNEVPKRLTEKGITFETTMV